MLYRWLKARMLCIEIALKARMLRIEIALMHAHVVEWEDDLRRLPGVIGEYQRRIVEAEAALRDLTGDR